MVRWLALVASLAAGAAQAQLVFEGDVPGEGAFFEVPFEVPAGTAEVEVRHDDLSGPNILDWGLLQPDGGFRGWGGGNGEPAVVAERAASRSYLTGPLPAGTWRVLVGKALIAERPARYRIEVDLRPSATLAPQPERRPYAEARPLRTGPAWYAGDMHVHSLQSGDATASLAQIAALAGSRGLDFVALSDHNTSSHLDFIADAQGRLTDLLLVPSVEFTTYAGHANAFGATRFVPFWLGLDGVSVDGAVQAYAAQGAVPTINHPTLDLGTFCIGCAWQHPLPATGWAAIEVGVGGWDGTGSLFDTAALTFWEGLADQGQHLAAVGGSDDHRAGIGLNQTQSPIGEPTTLIFADALSVPALKRGLREGRTVVKLRGPADPMIELSVAGGPRREGDTVFGRTATFLATVTGGVGDTLVWVENGVASAPVPIDADPFVAKATIEAPADFSARLRAEVRVGGVPRTVTSHVWLSPRFPVAPPLVAAHPAATGCAGCSGAAANPALLLALALVLRRRARGGPR